MSEKLIPVLAGSHREFRMFIHDLVVNNIPNHLAILNGSTALVDGVRYFYVLDERSLRGRRFKEFRLYGTWEYRNDGPMLADLIERMSKERV